MPRNVPPTSKLPPIAIGCTALWGRTINDPADGKSERGRADRPASIHRSLATRQPAQGPSFPTTSMLGLAARTPTALWGTNFRTINRPSVSKIGTGRADRPAPISRPLATSQTAQGTYFPTTSNRIPMANAETALWGTHFRTTNSTLDGKACRGRAEPAVPAPNDAPSAISGTAQGLRLPTTSSDVLLAKARTALWGTHFRTIKTSSDSKLAAGRADPPCAKITTVGKLRCGAGLSATSMPHAIAKDPAALWGRTTNSFCDGNRCTGRADRPASIQGPTAKAPTTQGLNLPTASKLATMAICLSALWGTHFRMTKSLPDGKAQPGRADRPASIFQPFARVAAAQGTYFPTTSIHEAIAKGFAALWGTHFRTINVASVGKPWSGRADRPAPRWSMMANELAAQGTNFPTAPIIRALAIRASALWGTHFRMANPGFDGKISTGCAEPIVPAL